MPYGLTPKEIDLLKKTFASAPEVKCVFIYGSRAKSTFKKTSDIDLAVEFSKKRKRSLAILKSEMEDLPLIYEIDLMDKDEMIKGNFKEEFKQTKKIFYSRK